MSNDYQPPAWSTPPPPRGEFTLEILKDGTIVGTHELKGKDFFILGRQHDAVDFPMDHLSVSRRHAVLNYRDDGALMLLDLNSALGTRLNKERIAPNCYRQVFNGDIIQFAASTRKYIANGPPEQSREEYDSENLAKYRAQLVAKTQRAEKRKHQQEEMMEEHRKQEEEEASKGVSWGFDDDAVDDLEETDGEGRNFSAQSQEGHGSNSDDAHNARWRSGGAERDDDDREQSSGNSSRRRMPEYLRKDQNYDRKYGTVYSADIDESQVSDKDKALLETILKKEKKIQNMQEEIKRIYMKENSQENGLIEGQVAVVTRNDAQIEALSADIDGLKKQIEDKNLQRKMGSSAGEGDKAGGNSGRLGGKRRRGSSGDDEEDDMIDMTSETADVRMNWRLRKKLAAKSHQQIGMRQQNQQQSLQQQQHHKQAALSYEEIKREVDRIEDILTLAENEAERLRSEAEAEFSNLAGGAADGSGFSEGDDLRDVMMMGRAKENAQKLRKIASEKAENELKLQRMRKLLKVATPALQSLISTGSDRANRPPMKFRSPIVDSSDDSCLPVHVVPLTAALVHEPNAGKENLGDAGIAGQRDSVNASIATSVSSAVQPNHHQQQQPPQPQQQQKLKTEEGIENPSDNNPSAVVSAPEVVSLDRFRRFVKEERAREAEERNGAGYLGASSSVTASASTSAVNARSTVLRPSPHTALSSSSLSALTELSSSSGVAATTPALVTHDAIYAPAKRYSVSVDRDVNTREGNNELTSSRSSCGKHTGHHSEGMSKIDHHMDKEWSNLHTAGPSSAETAPKSAGKSSTATTATSKSKSSSSSSSTKGMLEGGELAWVPPQGQTGDGRTSLNDKLGY